MPTVLVLGRGRIKVAIYFRDHDPPHVHVIAPGAEAIFEIESLRLKECDGFSPAALKVIRKALEENKEDLMEAWNGYKS